MQSRLYDPENHEQIREKCREKYRRNAPQRREESRRYRAANRDAKAEKDRAYYYANEERINEANRERHERQRGSGAAASQWKRQQRRNAVSVVGCDSLIWPQGGGLKWPHLCGGGVSL